MQLYMQNMNNSFDDNVEFLVSEVLECTVDQARSHGGHFGAVPPARAQGPPAKNSKINPILVTLKSYFLVFNTTCKTQLNNKFNQHHFIYWRG